MAERMASFSGLEGTGGAGMSEGWEVNGRGLSNGLERRSSGGFDAGACCCCCCCCCWREMGFW